MLIIDLCSMYVTHPFVICGLLATSPLCLSSASRLLYISDVKYKYSARWGDCPSVRISSWILPVNSHLSPLSPLPSGNSNLHRTSISLSLSPLKYKDTGIARAQHIHWSQVLNTSTSPPLVVDIPSYLSPLVSEFVGGTGSDSFSASHPDHLLVLAWDMVHLVLAQCFLERRKETHAHILSLTHNDTRPCVSTMLLQMSKKQNSTIKWHVLLERVQGCLAEGSIMEYASAHLYLDFPCFPSADVCTYDRVLDSISRPENGVSEEPF